MKPRGHRAKLKNLKGELMVLPAMGRILFLNDATKVMVTADDAQVKALTTDGNLQLKSTLTLKENQHWLAHRVPEFREVPLPADDDFHAALVFAFTSLGVIQNGQSS